MNLTPAQNPAVREPRHGERVKPRGNRKMEPLHFPPMTPKTAIRLACVTLAPLLLAACGGSGSVDGSPTVTADASPVVIGASGNEVIEPMTLFEKRRLIARISQDPRQIERLTIRERRELAAMAKAVQKHPHDED